MRALPIALVGLLPMVVHAEDRKPDAGSGSVKVTLAREASALFRAPGKTQLEPAVCSAEMDAENLRDLVRSAAKDASVDVKVALAILEEESAAGANLNSPKGARGPMQLMPETAAQYGVKDICNPVENVRGAMAYIKDLAAQFDGNVMLVAAAYYAGSERVYRAKGVPANSETVRYVASVANRYFGLDEISARRVKTRVGKDPGATAIPEGDRDVNTAGANKAPQQHQEWIGGSVLYVQTADEGESK